MIIPTGNQWEIVHRIILLPFLFDQFLARKLKKNIFFLTFVMKLIFYTTVL